METIEALMVKTRHQSDKNDWKVCEMKPRVLGIYGGKLTGWRAAAAHVLTRIGSSLPSATRRAATDQLILRRPT